ncbi:MAG TPA: tRNA pseudouridine(38-40) synthase TruA [Ignavibacteriaceae bacterium]|jgi:tRNA pseudouridine38-40 synthase|nr:tRNA pseudouridine(38-40) synthase TruA [Ignavibacteriaceae bacterium]
MARFKLFIEYDGTRYSGWQKQPGQTSTRTIQGALYKAAEEIFKNENVDIQGSGRTDSGVHALSQIAHLDVRTMLAPEIIRMKLNDALPYDINILEVEKTHPKFHARHDAVKRSYIYRISTKRTAFGKNFVWWVKDKLDFDAMKKAAEQFKGMHDFSSFSDQDPKDKSTKVLVDDVQVVKEGDIILIRITGSHFLWKMVRRMVGILVEVGRRKMTGADIKIFLITRSKEPAQYTAPPSGLFLEQVYYKGDNTGVKKFQDSKITRFQDFS